MRIIRRVTATLCRSRGDGGDGCTAGVTARRHRHLRRQLWISLALVMPVALLATTSSAYAEAGTAAVAWGSNVHKQLGAGFHSNFEGRPVTVLGLGDIAALAAGWEASFALLANGTVRAWGDGYRGQLGNNKEDEGEYGTPAAVKTELGELENVAAIAIGGAHDMALLHDGTVLTWGDSMDGTRGNGESGSIGEAREQAEKHGTPYANRWVAATGPALSEVKEIAAGGDTDYALLENGKVMAWGGNGNGKLGIEVEPGKGLEAKPEICKVEASKKRIEEEIAEGKEPEAGLVSCSKVPVEVKLKLPEGVRVESIAAGYSSAFAVLSNGGVMAWGNGNDGELGTGKAEGSDRPVAVNMANVPSCPELWPAAEHCPVVKVSAGHQNVWALTAAGEVIGWGLNAHGTLGSESESECKHIAHICSLLPKTVIGPTAIGRITAISVGQENWGLALNAEGKIYALGSNEPWGQLGIGNVELTKGVPRPIEGLAGVGGIAAGEQNSLAFVDSGSGPAPLVTLTPGSRSLKVKWTVTAPEVSLRLTVIAEKGVEVKKGPESKTISLSSTGCSGESPCEYTFHEVRHGEELSPEDVYSIRFAVPGTANRQLTGTPLP